MRLGDQALDGIDEPDAATTSNPHEADKASRSSRRALLETRNARSRVTVLLRPPRRRPEHRAPKFAPGDALVAVLVQRVDRAEHVVRAHVDAEHLRELVVVP